MAAARGDFVRFVDADDFYPSESTAGLIRLTSGSSDVITYGATLFCDRQLKPVWTMRSRVQADAATACLLGRFAVRITSMLLPRAVLAKSGGWDAGFEVSGDWDFVLRALEHAPVRGDGNVASLYRRHPSGMTADVDRGQVAARRLVRAYFERHPEMRGSPLERHAKGMLEARAARIFLTHGRLGESLRHGGRALRARPRALSDELAAALPALRGHLRRGYTERRPLFS
jgi:hypothetical protein